MRIAKIDYFEEPPEPEVLTEEDYVTLVTMLGNRLVAWLGEDEVSEEFPMDAWESYFLVKTKWASKHYATGADFRRGFSQACSELEETGLYKFGETFYGSVDGVT